MLRPTVSVLLGFVVSLLSATMGWVEPESPAVLFEQPSHFTAPDGTDMLVAADTYRVEQSAEAQLRLVADSGQSFIAIQAAATRHEETVAAPLAMAIAEEGAELSTIELPSALSQRQLAVRLTQNIAPAQNEPFHLEYNMNRSGSDYGQRTTVSPEACQSLCLADSACQAFTFVKPLAGASAGQCYLKQAVPPQSGNPCCISAKRKSAQENVLGNVGW
jgi:hypothetical protein